MAQLTVDNIVSATDLRRRTKAVMARVRKGPLVIVSNSQTVGVMIDPKEYKELKKTLELYEDMVDIKAIEESKKRNDWVPLEEVSKELGLGRKA